MHMFMADIERKNLFVYNVIKNGMNGEMGKHRKLLVSPSPFLIFNRFHIVKLFISLCTNDIIATRTSIPSFVEQVRNYVHTFDFVSCEHRTTHNKKKWEKKRVIAV